MSCCSPSSHRETKLWLGLVAFVIGAVVLLQRFDLVPMETWDYLWPSILVVTGLKMMIMAGMKDTASDCCSSGDDCGACEGECDGACEMTEMPMIMPKKASKKNGKKK